jgi:hypothetical protein
MALTVGGEREAIYGALQAQLAELQRMANDGGLPVKVRLQAMGLAVQVAKAMSGILKDADTDRITAELAAMKKVVEAELERRKRERAQAQLRAGMAR